MLVILSIFVGDIYFLLFVYLTKSEDADFFYPHLQRHDIFKKRIDSHGNVIEVRQEGIGAPKVCEFYIKLCID